ncbi:MAG: lytic transglycosylase domain-containing protein [Pseudomonadota bacterium]
MTSQANKAWRTLLLSFTAGFVAAGVGLYAFPAVSKNEVPQPLEVLRVNAPLPPLKPENEAAPAPSAKLPKTDARVKLLKQGFEAAEKGDAVTVESLQKQIGDDAASDLLEWAYLRSAPTRPSYARLKKFLQEHDWPGESPIRLKAEQLMLGGNLSPENVISYFGDSKPEWPQGRIALAEALRKSGNKDQARLLIRDTWRGMDISAANEKEILSRFPEVITRADNKFRMDRYLYEENTKEASRIAQMLGGTDAALAQARIAVIKKESNAGQLIDKLSAASQQDAGILYSRIQLLRRDDRNREAVALMLKAPTDADQVVDGDAWWVERRLVARAALDLGDAKSAYQIAARHSALNDLERMEAEFHAGWIALRFLHDPRIADKHFTNLMTDAERPISVSRGAYWRGRTAESLGKNLDAQKFYKIASDYPTTYYGLLAHAKLGTDQFFLRTVPRASAATAKRFELRDTVRAARWLIAAGENGKARLFISDMAKNLKDPQELGMLAELSQDLKDITASVFVGKQALYRNMPLETYAFPISGVPNIFRDTDIERPLALAIARQESVFDPNIKSSAGATGLFQLMPKTAAAMAKHSNMIWQPKRITDPVYNTQLGVAYLNKLVDDLGGSYVLTFAAYNAGPGNVKKWIQRFGDPRDPSVDPIDWVERIPFTETRNYVMRVMENLQVYRARVKSNMTTALLIENDLRRGQLR